MNQHRHLAIVAGAATLLASTALASVYQSSSYMRFLFDRPNWFLYIAAVIAAVVAGSIGARALRVPIWLQPFAGGASLLLYVTVVFGDGHEILGVIPTTGTLHALADQINFAFREIAELSAPVPVHRGLLLLAVLGVGAVAIIVDFLAVSLQRASLAGLPLLVLYAVPVSIDRDGLAWWMFGLGAVGYLWLLVTDQLERVQRWGRPFRPAGEQEPWATTSLGSTGRWVGASGIVIAAIIPLLVPVSTEGWFGNGDGGPIGPGNGRSVATINPITQLRGRLVQKEEVEFLRLRTNDSGHFYLRVTTLDQFGTTGWTQRSLSATPQEQLSRGIKDHDIGVGTPTVDQKTQVEVRGFSDSSYLPVFANPTKVSARGDWRWDKKADTAFSTRTTTRGLHYSFQSRRVLYDARQLSAAPALSPDSPIVAEYTGTNGGAEAEAQKLVNDLILTKTTQYDKVMAINDYFSPANHFVYSTQTAQGTSGSDLMDFLQNRRGYCEQYASAMAYMVRAAGIPARVAIGFGYGKPVNGYTSITNHDAHAWVEVYFSGTGWVPFDPTPAGPGGRTGGLSWTQRDQGTDPTAGRNSDPTAPKNGQDTTHPQQDKPTDKSDHAVAPKHATGKHKLAPASWVAAFLGLLVVLFDGATVPTVPAWAWLLLAAVVALGLAVVPGLWRLETRRLRMAGARSVNPLVAAHSAWDELVDTLADVGLPVADAETPRGVARLLRAHGLSEVALEGAALLANAEEEVRYAPQAWLRGHRFDRAALESAAVLVCREVLAHSHPRIRLRARLLPPSLLARTARVVSGWAEAIAVGLANARLAAGRLIPRRRAA